MGVDRMLDPLCNLEFSLHLWPDLQGQILKLVYLENGRDDGHVTKGVWAVGCLHYYITLIMDFQGQVLKQLYLRNGRAGWHGTKGMGGDSMLKLLCYPWIFTSPMTLTLGFQGQILKQPYIRNGRADWHGIKYMTLIFGLTIDIELTDIFKFKF